MNEQKRAERQAIIEVMIAEIRKQATNSIEVGSIADAVLLKLAELRKEEAPSEELVGNILSIMQAFSRDYKTDNYRDECVLSEDYIHISIETAKLITPSQSYQAWDEMDAQNVEYRANRFIQALLDDGITLDSEMQNKIAGIYMTVK